MIPASCASLSAEQTCTNSFAARRKGIGPLARQHGAQIRAFDVFHDEVQRPIPLAEVEGLDDIGVSELADRLRLEAKPTHHLLVLRGLGVQDLHRGELAQLQVFDAIDHAHPACAQAVEHTVAPIDDPAEPRVRLVAPIFNGDPALPTESNPPRA